MSTSPPETPPSRPATGAWRALGWWAETRPWLTVLGVSGLALAAALAASIGLGIQPGYVDLLDPESPGQARHLELLRQFGNVEALHVIVEADDRERAAAFIDAFGPAVRELRGDGPDPLAAEVLDRVDLAWFRRRLPAYLPDEALAVLAAAAASPDAPLEDLVRDPAADRILRALDQALARAGASDAALLTPAERADPRLGPEALAALLRELAAAARGEDASLGAWLDRLVVLGAPGLVTETGHLRIDERRLVVTITPSDVRNDFRAMDAFMRSVRRAGDASAARVGGDDVRVAYTGAPALLVDEMRASRRDVLRSTLVALVLVSALFFFSFHSVADVAFAVLALLAGLGLTFGAALVLVGTLNLFSVVFAAVLVGLGIDFGIHVVHQREELVRQGTPPIRAVGLAVAAVAPPTTVGALTTAAAFLATTLSDFRGFSQLGLISGVGVLLCLATALTLLPALLVLRARRAGRASAASRRRLAHPWSRRVLRLPLRSPRATAGIGLVAILGAGTVGLVGLEFDHDLLNLQPAGTEAVALQRGEDGRRVATHFAYSLVGTLEEARRRQGEFAALGTVASARSCLDVLPPTAGVERQRHLVSMAASLRDAAAAPAPVLPVDVSATRAALADLELTVQDYQDLAFDADRRDAVAALDTVLGAIAELREALAATGKAGAGLASFREGARRWLVDAVLMLPVLAREGVQPADLPAGLRSRFVGADGRLAVLVEPKGAVWDRRDLEAFVTSARRVDPEITGPPVQILDVTETMRSSLEVAAVVAFLAIAAIVAASLRSAGGTVVALAPLGAGFLLMVGLLTLARVPLNPANLIALPLVLGLGVDNAVHVAHRWLRCRDAGQAIDEVGHAIVVTSLTTIAGFSGLLVAGHRGVRSLGVVACVGTAAMLLSSTVLLPAVLRSLEARRGDQDVRPGEDRT